MKRKFTTSSQVKNFLNELLTQTEKIARPEITEQLYKDSEEYTYELEHDMYKSGEVYSDFEQGIIAERSPYVRRRYYEGGIPGKKSPAKAGPEWFERCFNDHKADYENQCKKVFNRAKKEV